VPPVSDPVAAVGPVVVSESLPQAASRMPIAALSTSTRERVCHIFELTSHPLIPSVLVVIRAL
jgi:hypothetical protein